MKNLVLYFIIFLLPVCSHSQTNQGYKTYDSLENLPSAEFIEGIFPKAEGYIALSLSAYGPLGNLTKNSVLLNMDNDRNVIDTIHLPLGGNLGSHYLLKINNNKFLACGGFIPPDAISSNERHAFYAIVDGDLNLLFYNEIEPDENTQFVQITSALLTQEGNLDLNITKGGYAEFSDKILRRIDIEGNTIFDLEIQDDWTYTDFGNHFQTSDGNFIMATTHEPATGNSYSHVRIFKSTYEGEIIWETNNIVSTGAADICDEPFIHPLPNDHTLLIFCRDSLTTPFGLHKNTNVNFLIYDADGNEVEERYLLRTSFIFVYNIRMAENGDLLLAGTGFDDHPLHAWFARVNSDLEFVFEAWVYVPSTYQTDLWERCFGYDFNETPDGGYIGSGLGWEALPDGSDVQQDGFTVKFDADGCWNPDCIDPVISSDLRIEVFTPAREVKVYPNPASGSITLDTDFGSGGRVAVYSATGQQVMYTEPSGSRPTLDISDLASGMYFVHLTDGEGREMRARFVKEISH